MKSIRAFVCLLLLSAVSIAACAVPVTGDAAPCAVSMDGTPAADSCFDTKLSAVGTPLRSVMPTGDSNTCGADGFGGYRAQLFPYISGKAISVGPLDSAVYCGGPGRHAGYSGSHTTGYSTYLQGYIALWNPEILFMMLGTNGDSDGQNYVDILLRPTLTNYPNIKIVVAAIPNAPVQGTYPATYNASLQAAVTSMPEYGWKVFYTNKTAQLDPNTDFMPDGLHANQYGSNKIANAFFLKFVQITR